jgi:RND family efflux transporter MFP subunit
MRYLICAFAHFVKEQKSFFLITLLAIWGAGCSKSPKRARPDEPLPVVRVQVAPVLSGQQASTEEVVGTVRSKLRASIEAKTSGRIERMEVVPGQAVKSGELLAQLDAREIQSRLDQARAQCDQAEQDLQRYSTLLKESAVTRAEFEAVQTRRRVAQGAVEEAETFLGDAKVTAPFDGVITRKMAEVGDLAAPGRALLEMEDLTRLRFEMDVSEAVLDNVKIGDRLPVEIPSAGLRTNAVVAEMAPSASPLSRTYLVKVDLSPSARLRPGQFGRARVPIGESSIPTVPVSALVKRGQIEQVYVVEAGKARLRIVKTGKTLGEVAEMLAGVEPGEKVVVSSPAQLRDGQPVEVGL